MDIQNFHFSAQDQRLAATTLRRLPDAPLEVMTLHGLGATANRHTARYLLEPLAERGHGALCFEFSGNGESSGVLETATLQRRRHEAIAAAAHLDPTRRPVLIGTSMGAHLAAWITPLLRPRALVLFCPAAYPASALESPFDGGLAKPGRHADSPAYGGLSEWGGDLLIVAARRDQVVPAETIDGYVASARHARRRRVLWLDGCDHFIHRWLPHQGREKDEVLAAILDVVATPPMT